MNCVCIKENKFNFTISFLKDYAIFTDYSEWSNDANSLMNEKIEIVIKGDNNFKSSFTIKPYQSVILEYNKLQYSDCGYDGIYEFEITTCNNTQKLSKTVYLLRNVECAYTTLILNKDYDNAFNLLKYIEMIKANMYVNNVDQAKELYNLAVRFIKRLNCNCN